MQLYNTVNDIREEVGVLVRNMTGRAGLSAGEHDLINSAIVDAYQMVLLEYGLDSFRFQIEDDTVETTAGTAYVDLDEYVYRIVPGSVWIRSQDQQLAQMDEEAVFAADPGLEQTGVPIYYSYMAQADPNILRLRLWPEPDAAYTINLKQYKYPDDDIENFPAWCMMAIKNKAKSLSVLGLGLPQLMPGFEAAYEEAIARVKHGYNVDGPRHIGRTVLGVNRARIEGRLSNG